MLCSFGATRLLNTGTDGGQGSSSVSQHALFDCLAQWRPLELYVGLSPYTAIMRMNSIRLPTDIGMGRVLPGASLCGFLLSCRLRKIPAHPVGSWVALARRLPGSETLASQLPAACTGHPKARVFMQCLGISK